MTSKTFKSADGKRSIEVYSSHNPGEVVLTVKDDRGFYHTIPDLPQDSVTALAHAILHASYPTLYLPYEVGEAKNYLLRHMETVQREAERAIEQAELEAEALELANARREPLGLTRLERFTESNVETTGWLAVARKAREMRGAGK